jgi:hypothetical protein
MTDQETIFEMEAINPEKTETETETGNYNKYKETIYRWRANHKKEYNEYSKKMRKEYYAKNIELIRQKRQAAYRFKKVSEFYRLNFNI